MAKKTVTTGEVMIGVPIEGNHFYIPAGEHEFVEAGRFFVVKFKGYRYLVNEQQFKHARALGNRAVNSKNSNQKK